METKFYTKAVKKAVIKYEKEHIKRIVLKLNIKTDNDIIQYLNTKDNINKYLKELVRNDICAK